MDGWMNGWIDERMERWMMCEPQTLCPCSSYVTNHPHASTYLPTYLLTYDTYPLTQVL